MLNQVIVLLQAQHMQYWLKHKCSHSVQFEASVHKSFESMIFLCPIHLKIVLVFQELTLAKNDYQHRLP